VSITEDKAAGTLYKFQLSVLLDANLTLDNCTRGITVKACDGGPSPVLVRLFRLTTPNIGVKRTPSAFLGVGKFRRCIVLSVQFQSSPVESFLEASNNKWHHV